MSAFRQAVEDISRLPAESREALESCTYTRSMQAEEVILPLNAVCRHFYFVERGMLRIYYLKDGRDITEWFATDHQFCFSIVSYFQEQPSKLIIECLEDSEIRYLPKDKLEHLSMRDLGVGRFYRTLIAGSLILSQIRMESIQFETALQRYQGLMDAHPEIIRRAPVKYIASFLGISFETLSRIRSQVH